LGRYFGHFPAEICPNNFLVIFLEQKKAKIPSKIPCFFFQAKQKNSTTPPERVIGRLKPDHGV
jgi:hypothetical protein